MKQHADTAMELTRNYMEVVRYHNTELKIMAQAWDVYHDFFNVHKEGKKPEYRRYYMELKELKNKVNTKQIKRIISELILDIDASEAFYER